MKTYLLLMALMLATSRGIGSETDAPKVEEVRVIVRHVVAAGIFGERMFKRIIPARSHTAGTSSATPRPSYVWESTGQMMVLTGYAKQGEVADGDQVTAQAYRDGAVKLPELGFEDTPTARWRVAE